MPVDEMATGRTAMVWRPTDGAIRFMTRSGQQFASLPTKNIAPMEKWFMTPMTWTGSAQPGAMDQDEAS